jgi:translation initiation factor 2 subunit 1
MAETVGTLPEEGDFVVATVRSIRNFGALVTLDEYRDREAFIHLSEVATGWVKYIRDYIREGQKIVGRVIHIDHEKGQVDLSLKRINEHQRREKLQSFKNEQRAHKLLDLVAKSLHQEPAESMTKFGNALVEQFGGLFQAFETASSDPARFSAESPKGPWVEAFLKVAHENISPPHVEVSGMLEVSHPGPTGVEAVREALLAAEQAQPNAVMIQYVGAPRYRVVVTGAQYKPTEELLKKASDLALSRIKASGGKGTFTHL